MKNKGFTLAELLGVITILAIIALITTVTITNSMKNSKEKLYDIQIDNIIVGAKTWASSNVFSLPENEGEHITITLGQLKESGFVENDITDPISNRPFDNSMQIMITKVGNTYKYEIVE